MSDLIHLIARSLGREKPLDHLPDAAPTIFSKVARLVGPDADLTARFIATATAAKMHVEPTSVEELPSRLVERMRQAGLRTAILTRSDLSEPIREALRAVGVQAEFWSDTTLDAAYDVDVGITEVYRAVAETGSIVVRESIEHGRAVSLVPPFHFAIVRKSQIVPDLIDLMADVQRDGSASGTVIITGPSKTADIEMNLVTGVHGPGEVVIFLID
jgi:L-lactate dehydrogenase complex protein LldG